MKSIPLVLAALFLLAGCESGPGRSASVPTGQLVPSVIDDIRRDSTVEAVDTNLPPEPLAVQDPHPSLARAVEHGEARSSGPVTNERYALWNRKADIQVRLAGQKGRLLYLEDLLKLAARNEEEFIERLNLDYLPAGCPPDRHLKIYGLVKTRIRGEIEQSKREIAALQQLLAQTTATSVVTTSTNGETSMREKTLNEFGLSAAEIEKLAAIGVRGSRDFIEHFYLPEQHAPLAALLGRDVDDVKALIAKMAEGIPAEDLGRLAAQAHQPRAFGVLPPDGESRRADP